MADSLTADRTSSSSFDIRQKLSDTITYLRSSFSNKNDASSGSRGRRRIGIIIVFGLFILLLIPYNLKLYYASRVWYRSQTGWVVSLVLEIVISLVLLAILSTIVTEFLTSLVVALAAIGIYIAITLLVDSSNAVCYGRTMASWSIPTFWIAFVIDAPLKLGYRLTDLIARRLEGAGEGRIRLPERNEDTSKFRYTPPLSRSSDGPTTSVADDMDLEGASQSSGRTYATI